MEQKAFSITQINEYIRDMLSRDHILDAIAVVGEVSNYKVYPSGHHYFTLKDDNASLKCVMFRGNSFKLKFRPENGMKIIAMGKISVYPRDGAYQLYCTAMMPVGIGDLHAAFEQMKAKLAAEGLFEESHKTALPDYPGVIGIVTSSAGAAVHDMIRILRKRYPLAKVRLLPVKVQGDDAPAEISGAIEYANAYNLADLLIVGRGGGSLEDLWAFNSELVARAIYNSVIPVISAVGHEPDVTISDYVADLRAATPSNAAELAVPDSDNLKQLLDSYIGNMSSLLNKSIANGRRQLALLASSPALKSPEGYLTQRRKLLEYLSGRFISAQDRILRIKNEKYIALVSKLDAMSPLKVLTRGYAMARKADGTVIKKVSQVSQGETISVDLSDGVFSATVKEVQDESAESNI